MKPGAQQITMNMSNLMNCRQPVSSIPDMDPHEEEDEEITGSVLLSNKEYFSQLGSQMSMKDDKKNKFNHTIMALNNQNDLHNKLPRNESASSQHDQILRQTPFSDHIP